MELAGFGGFLGEQKMENSLWKSLIRNIYFKCLLIGEIENLDFSRVRIQRLQNFQFILILGSQRIYLEKILVQTLVASNKYSPQTEETKNIPQVHQWYIENMPIR